MPTKPVRVRLDKVLTDRGLAETRTRAQALIMAGRVTVDGAVVNKAGTPVSETAVLAVTANMPYVSRGGLKLEAALNGLHASPEGKICMDIGASTGGFTDCMLQEGALKVYAFDVGHGQLHWKLRNDPRVINTEGVNFRHLDPASLKEPVEFVTIDVSFISLDKILPVAAQCLLPGGEILAMVKPQFEAERHEIKKGVVRDEGARVRAIKKIRTLAQQLGLTIVGGMDSPVKGPEGNVEHFLRLKK